MNSYLKAVILRGLDLLIAGAMLYVASGKNTSLTGAGLVLVFYIQSAMYHIMNNPQTIVYRVPTQPTAPTAGQT